MATRIKIFKQNNHNLDPGIEINYGIPASTRGIDMLLKKVKGQKIQTEVAMTAYHDVNIPFLKKELSRSKIALVTDGGLVPRGNPDNLYPVNADRFCMYSIHGKDRLEAAEYEVSHQGYNGEFVLEDPNRLLPVDGLRSAEKENRIGELGDIFYTTAGVMTSIENSTMFGEKIAASLAESQVDGVILTSSCGTSTRCGALIAREIEKKDIPVVQVTNLTKIAEVVGSNRIFKGSHVCYVFGKPELPKEEEYKFRKNMVFRALALLSEAPKDNKPLIWNS